MAHAVETAHLTLLFSFAQAFDAETAAQEQAVAGAREVDQKCEFPTPPIIPETSAGGSTVRFALFFLILFLLQLSDAN